MTKGYPEFRRRRQIAYEVFSKCQNSKMLPDGMEFVYPKTAKWDEKLQAFKSFWRTGLPFFDTQVETLDEIIVLRVRGPEGARERLQSFIEEDLSDNPASLKRRIKFGFRRLTGFMRMKPDFLIIGAAKCGTTSVYQYLLQHPSIGRTFRKEIYFIDRNFHKGMNWYRAYFPILMRKLWNEKFHQRPFVSGEATPCYLFHPHAPKRVFQNFPRIKLIAILRNPIDRAYSYYHMKLRYGYEDLTFEECIKAEDERLSGELEKMLLNENYFSFNRQHYSYLARGIYADQLESWFKFFPREQMLILRMEDLYKDQSKTLNCVAEFLNLPSWIPKPEGEFNSIPYPKMNTETRSQLIDYFRPHNQRLRELLNMEFEWDK